MEGLHLQAEPVRDPATGRKAGENAAGRVESSLPARRGAPVGIGAAGDFGVARVDELVAPARPVVALPVQHDARREVRPEVPSQVEPGALLVGGSGRRNAKDRDRSGRQTGREPLAPDGSEMRFQRISSKSGASGTTPARAAIENSTRRAASPESPISRVSAETYIFTNWRPSSRSRPRPKRRA